MKYIIIFLIGFVPLTCFSQNQGDMNEDASKSFEKADNELNDIYQSILKEYKLDTVFIKNLKASQRIWITFRDAELKVKYPERESGYYGSVYPMCISFYLEKLTRDRIKTLKEWIEGVEEGDVCVGSIKIIEK